MVLGRYLIVGYLDPLGCVFWGFGFVFFGRFGHALELLVCGFGSFWVCVGALGLWFWVVGLVPETSFFAAGLETFNLWALGCICHHSLKVNLFWAKELSN